MFVSSLEKLVVLMMEQYPRFAIGYHKQCYQALSKVMLALAPHGAVLRTFLSHISKCLEVPSKRPYNEFARL